jgi:Tol biopolymer transport system component
MHQYRSCNPTAWVARTLFIFTFAVLLVSCTQPLLVTSTPSGALASVTDEDGRVVGTGPTPLEVQVAFTDDGGETYLVDVEPTVDQAELYLPATKQVTGEAYAALPLAGDGKARQIDFELEEKEYVNLPLVEVELTPDGQWVGVITKTRSFKDLAEEGGITPQLIVDFGENRGLQSLSLSPDGERIVFSDAVFETDNFDMGDTMSVRPDRIIGLKGANLRGINIAGGGVQHITTEDFRDMFPSFTPRGEQILFASNRRRTGLLDILRIRAAGRSGISNIYVNHRNGMTLKPTSAADGTIAFCVAGIEPISGAVTDYQIWTIGGPNEFPTQITRGQDPAISPNGEFIAYIGTDGNLWVSTTDGSNQTQLTSGSDGIMQQYRDSLSNTERQRLDANISLGVSSIRPFSQPSWTPDGENILYTSMEGTDKTGRPNQDIWTMRIDGSDKLQLTTNGSTDRYPLMSPDGNNIYFLSNRGESWAIWRISTAPVE